MQEEMGKWEALSERVRILERQNRRLRQTGVAALLILASVFLMGQTKTSKVGQVKAVKVLEAGKFILNDGRGKTRAELSLFADRPALVFYDDGGTPTLSLGVEPEGSGVTLYDAGGDNAATLATTPNGPVLTLYSEGRKRLNLSVTGQSPALGLLGKNNEAKLALGLTTADDPFLHLFGPGERGGVQLLAAPDRTALRFFDASNHARAVLGTLERESAPGLVLNDETGTARAILMLTDSGPSMDFFDKNRMKIWTAR